MTGSALVYCFVISGLESILGCPRWRSAQRIGRVRSVNPPKAKKRAPKGVFEMPRQDSGGGLGGGGLVR